MKFGLRIPSLSKSIAARLSVKRALGIKVPRPDRAPYNYVYNRVTFSPADVLRWLSKRK